MPKIIVTGRCIKANAHKRFGNFVKYIATINPDVPTHRLLTEYLKNEKLTDTRGRA